MSPCDPHSIVNISSPKPSGGTNYSKRDIHVDWRIVDDYFASLKLDVHFSFIKRIGLEVHRDFCNKRRKLHEYQTFNSS